MESDWTRSRLVFPNHLLLVLLLQPPTSPKKSSQIFPVMCRRLAFGKSLTFKPAARCPQWEKWIGFIIIPSFYFFFFIPDILFIPVPVYTDTYIIIWLACLLLFRGLKQRSKLCWWVYHTEPSGSCSSPMPFVSSWGDWICRARTLLPKGTAAIHIDYQPPQRWHQRLRQPPLCTSEYITINHKSWDNAGFRERCFYSVGNFLSPF